MFIKKVLSNENMCSTFWMGKFAVTILKNIFERVHILSIYRITYSQLHITQYHSNICLTAYLSLTNLFLVHPGQYLLFLTTWQKRQILLETHYLSYCLPINQIIWFKQKTKSLHKSKFTYCKYPNLVYTLI